MCSVWSARVCMPQSNIQHPTDILSAATHRRVTQVRVTSEVGTQYTACEVLWEHRRVDFEHLYSQPGRSVGMWSIKNREASEIGCDAVLIVMLWCCVAVMWCLVLLWCCDAVMLWCDAVLIVMLCCCDMMLWCWMLWCCDAEIWCCDVMLWYVVLWYVMLWWDAVLLWCDAVLLWCDAVMLWCCDVVMLWGDAVIWCCDVMCCDVMIWCDVVYQLWCAAAEKQAYCWQVKQLVVKSAQRSATTHQIWITGEDFLQTRECQDLQMRWFMLLLKHSKHSPVISAPHARWSRVYIYSNMLVCMDEQLLLILIYEHCTVFGVELC